MLRRLVTLCVVILLAACGGTANAIVGEWTTTHTPTMTFEFFQDGTVTFAQAGRTFTGQYKFIDSNNIRLDIVGDLGQQSFVLKDINIAGDTLTLTLNGQQLELSRAQQGNAQPKQPSSKASGPNLVTNPSFEDGSREPTGWECNAYSKNKTTVWDATSAHSGKRSIVIKNIGPTGGSGLGNWYNSDYIHLDSASEYEVSLWYRSTAPAAPPNGPATAFMMFISYGNNYPGFDFAPANDWTFVKTTIKGQDHETLRLQFFLLSDVKGDALWIDDVSIKEIAK